MIFKPKTWQVILFVLQAILLVFAAVNLVAAGFAASASEGRHAVTHIVLGGASGLLAWLLAWWRRRGPGPAAQSPGLEALQDEVSNLRRELTETQERLDFTERMLAQRPQQRQVGPDR